MSVHVSVFLSTLALYVRKSKTFMAKAWEAGISYNWLLLWSHRVRYGKHWFIIYPVDSPVKTTTDLETVNSICKL